MREADEKLKIYEYVALSDVSEHALEIAAYAHHLELVTCSDCTTYVEAILVCRGVGVGAKF